MIDVSTVHNGEGYRVKDRHKATVFREILHTPSPTRRSIRRSLAFRSSTVSAAVQELIEDNLVKELYSKNSGTPGRPSLVLSPVRNRLLVMTFYIEDRYLIGALVNLTDQILAKQMVFLPQNVDANGFIQAFIEMEEQLHRQVPTEGELLGIAVAPVGSVDITNKVWLSCTRWPSMTPIDFAVLEQYSPHVPIHVRRNLETVLSHQLTTHRRYRYGGTGLFHWGYGIGFAYAHDGQLMESGFGRFGDVGHTRVYPDSSKLCRCGAQGCLEAEAALWALLPALHATEPALADESYEFSSLLKGEWLLSLPEVQHALEAVKLSLVNTFRMFHPTRILLIGPFMENHAIASQVTQYLEDSLPSYVDPHDFETTIVNDAFAGCLYANAYPFFASALRSMLTARR